MGDWVIGMVFHAQVHNCITSATLSPASNKSLLPHLTLFLQVNEGDKKAAAKAEAEAKKKAESEEVAKLLADVAATPKVALSLHWQGWESQA